MGGFNGADTDRRISDTGTNPHSLHLANGLVQGFFDRLLTRGRNALGLPHLGIDPE